MEEPGSDEWADEAASFYACSMCCDLGGDDSLSWATPGPCPCGDGMKHSPEHWSHHLPPGWLRLRWAAMTGRSPALVPPTTLGEAVYFKRRLDFVDVG
eukprot:3697763-Amphidinium_carterae.1